MKREKNKGFSLVELVAVIAIMAILSGTLSVMLSRNGVRVNECANEIHSALKETRTDALSKKTAYVTIRWDDSSKKYVISETGKDDVKVGDASTIITVFYESEDGTGSGSDPDPSFVLDSFAGNVILTYNRASGAFYPMIESVDTAAGTITYKELGGEKIYCTSFQIERGSKTKEVVLVRETGKVYINE
jgi:prepilin-type N-terminal cleavage/methylation domain-containing protein